MELVGTGNQLGTFICLPTSMFTRQESSSYFLHVSGDMLQQC